MAAQDTGDTPGLEFDGLKLIGEENARYLVSKIRTIPDFPGKGVMFRDVMPILTDAKAFGLLINAMVETLPIPASEFDYIGGLEARGFLVGVPLACKLKKGFLPIRKLGKLPPPTLKQSYELEYGAATIEIEDKLLPQGSHVLIVDDLMATGGTATAAKKLVERTGSTVVGFSFAVELEGQGGRERLGDDPISVLMRMS